MESPSIISKKEISNFEGLSIFNSLPQDSEIIYEKKKKSR